MNSRIENVAPSIQITVNLLRKLSVSGAPGPAGSMSVMAFYEKVVKVKADVAAYLN